MVSDRSISIGRVKGPGSSPHSFSFIAFKTTQTLRTGDFVICRIRADGGERTTLARIIDRQPLRSYPASFLTTPTFSPDEVAASVGYNGDYDEQSELVAEMIGYYNRQLEAFVNPRVQPAIGSMVGLASSHLLSQLLNRQPQNQVGAATVGWLLSREAGEVPVVLDVATIASTHLAIISSTGAGKSYLASVIVEEMMRPNNRAAVLIIDPHGEHGTFNELPNHHLMIDDNYRPQIAVHKPGELKIRVGSLSLTDLRYLLPNLSERMEYVLGLAYRRVQKQSQATWTLSDLRQAIREVGQAPNTESNGAGQSSKKGTSYRETANAVLWRLSTVFEDAILFDDRSSIQLRDLVRPGKCTVLQLNEINLRQQQVMVAALLRHLYRARIQSSKGLVSKASPLYLPYPVFIVIEEAHHFAPASGESVSGGILKQILGEGRKFGLGVGLISQRPGKLDSDVLSQCNTQCLLRIVNPVDQAKVRESVESVGQELLRELPALSKGQAIIAGAAVNTPILCRVRQRYTTHSSQDISAPQVWRAYFARKRVEQRMPVPR